MPFGTAVWCADSHLRHSGWLWNARIGYPLCVGAFERKEGPLSESFDLLAPFALAPAVVVADFLLPFTTAFKTEDLICFGIGLFDMSRIF